MKTFYIITNNSKDPMFDLTNEIRGLIEEAGACGVIAKEDDGQYQVPPHVDCIVTLGGDGTLIRATSDLHEYDIPFIGVNLGTLGYLTEIERESLRADICQLVNGETLIEERMMIRGEIKQDTMNDTQNDRSEEVSRSKNLEEVALNDIVVTREGSLRTIRFQIYVNGAYLHSYKADGMIISTPTGSTGYSMSAGGPIVEPTASLFIVTPICSHSLNSRSIILSSEDVIEIVLGGGREGALEEASVSFDGGASFGIKTGERVKITKADRRMKLMKLSSVSFLETLSKKMAGN